MYNDADFKLFGVPPATNFVARDAEMESLVEKLVLDRDQEKRRQKVVVLHGLGGIGKTQLALAFARKYRGQYNGAFWLDGSSEERLKNSFKIIASQIQGHHLRKSRNELPEDLTLGMWTKVYECLRWLSLPANDRWLLIIDNVGGNQSDEGEAPGYDIEKYLPHAQQGSILFTSRLSTLLPSHERIELGVIEREQARAIFENNAGKSIHGIDNILNLLDGLPLALAQAGTYMRATKISASKYAKQYDENWVGLMEEQTKQHTKYKYEFEKYEQNVLTAWTLSYQQLERESVEAARLFTLWAFLDNGELWHELLAPGPELSQFMGTPRWLLNIAKSKEEFENAAKLLCRYSLASATEKPGVYRMHPVVHRWCGQLTKGTLQHELRCIAAGLIAKGYISKNKAEYFSVNSRLRPHAIRVSKCMDSVGIIDNDNIDPQIVLPPKVFANLGALLSFKEVERQWATIIYRRGLEAAERKLGPEDLNTLRLCALLAGQLSWTYNFFEAKKYYKRTVEGYEKILGPNAPITLITVCSMASVYQRIGRRKKAKELRLRALKEMKKICAPENEPFAHIAHSLASLYSATGDYEEAEKWAVTALTECEKSVGPKQPLTIYRTKTLAAVYVKLERYDKAEDLYRRAADTFAEIHGPKYPETLRTIYKLARVYDAAGRRKEAEGMYRQVLQGFENTVGLKDTINSTLPVAGAWRLCYRVLEDPQLFGHSYYVCRKTATWLWKDQCRQKWKNRMFAANRAARDEEEDEDDASDADTLTDIEKEWKGELKTGKTERRWHEKMKSIIRER